MCFNPASPGVSDVATYQSVRGYAKAGYDHTADGHHVVMMGGDAGGGDRSYETMVLMMEVMGVTQAIVLMVMVTRCHRARWF